MTVETCLNLTIRLISFAIVLQTLEILLLKPTWNSRGIWTWEALREDYTKSPKWIVEVIHFFLKDNVFQFLMLLQILFAVINTNFPNLWLSLAMLVLLLLQMLRWRGFFNGGSDSMTFVVLFSCVLALLMSDNERIQKALVWYIGLQAILSYFVAGVAKAKHKEWWSGKALTQLLTNSSYITPQNFQRIITPSVALTLSLGILLFELLSPLALVNKQLASLFIFAAAFFHLMNFLILGLNRFVFAWLAAYPALYFLAGSAI